MKLPNLQFHKNFCSLNKQAIQNCFAFIVNIVLDQLFYGSIDGLFQVLVVLFDYIKNLIMMV